MEFKIYIYVFFSIQLNVNCEWTQMWKLIGLTRVAVCEEGADGEENFRNG